MRNITSVLMFCSGRYLQLQNRRSHLVIGSWALGLKWCQSWCHELCQSQSRQQTLPVETLLRQLISEFQHSLCIMNQLYLTWISLSLLINQLDADDRIATNLVRPLRCLPLLCYSFSTFLDLPWHLLMPWLHVK